MTDPAPARADPYGAAAASAARLAQLTGRPAHDVAVVLGSGWLPAADALGAADTEVPLAELGGFAEPTVAGHIPVVRSVAVARSVAVGRSVAVDRSVAVGGLRALVFLGRTHLYEGYPVTAVVHGVRMAIAAGCRVVVLTNAAGGIRDDLRPGQPVLISDQLNLTARSPLSGPPPPAGYQPRFTDLSDLYSARLRALARQADPDLAEGVYAALPGPHYETPAEIRMLRGLGADLVGMSTALEAIAARHLGAEVLGISLVTNIAAGLSGQPLNHAEVLATGQASAARMGGLLAQILPGLR
jgi:purine-nucleoside phosphorylase